MDPVYFVQTVAEVVKPKTSGSTKDSVAVQALKSLEQSCAGCSLKGRDFKLCGNCKIAAYHSRECQVAHWKVHKLSCNSSTQTKTETDEKQAKSQPAAKSSSSSGGVIDFVFDSDDDDNEVSAAGSGVTWDPDSDDENVSASKPAAPREVTIAEKVDKIIDQMQKDGIRIVKSYDDLTGGQLSKDLKEGQRQFIVYLEGKFLARQTYMGSIFSKEDNEANDGVSRLVVEALKDNLKYTKYFKDLEK